VIAGLRHRCAVLIIAHRLSTVRDADAIVVLQDGRVVESGTPGELLARPGWYATHVERQSVSRSLQAGPHA
jgi:ABC-type multidrug transport system fused ATPase/permease subunit